MRLIDANELIKRTWRWAVNSREAVQQMINGCPTVEAVQVVRCRDCAYWQDNNGGYPNDMCKWNQDETPDPDDYCSLGERVD